MRVTKPVFIVHTAPDKAAARGCRDALRDAGVEAFLDDEIELGLPWDDVLEAALEAAQVILVLVTPEWKRGHYNKDEVATAIARARKSDFAVRVVPVFFAGGTVKHSPYGLQRIQGVDLGAAPRWDVLAQHVVKVLGDSAPESPTKPPAPSESLGAQPKGLDVRALRETLVRLYPKSRSIARVLRDAGVATADIDLNGGARDVWDEALEEAARHGKVGAIEAIAREEYPAAFDGDGPPVRSATAPATAPATASATPRRLSRHEVEIVVKIAVRYRADRSLLLEWLPDGVAESLEVLASPAAQLTADVSALNKLTASDEPPVVTWLQNLASRVKPFPQDHQLVMGLIERLTRG